jgi:hypothetical protein
MSNEDIKEIIEEKNRDNLFLNDNTANPAPLGLCAFGMTTILLSLHNAGLTWKSHSCDGNILWGNSPGYRRRHEMKEEEHVWHGHLWQILSFSGSPFLHC